MKTLRAKTNRIVNVVNRKVSKKIKFGKALLKHLKSLVTVESMSLAMRENIAGRKLSK